MATSDFVGQQAQNPDASVPKAQASVPWAPGKSLQTHPIARHAVEQDQVHSVEQGAGTFFRVRELEAETMYSGCYHFKPWGAVAPLVAAPMQ